MQKFDDRNMLSKCKIRKGAGEGGWVLEVREGGF